MESNIDHEKLAHSIADSLKAEIRIALKDEIREMISQAVKSEAQKYYGDMSSSNHAIKHDRIDKFLNSIDRLSDNIWSTIIGGFLKWLLTVLLIGMAAYAHFSDKFGQ